MEKKRNKNKIHTRAQNCRVFLILPASFLLLSLFLPLPAEAAALSSSGDWLQTVGASDLTFGIGSELTDTYLSPVITTTLDVTGCTDATEAWWILIKRIDQNWDSGRFVLSVRRTSEGTGEGIIEGGDAFQEVTASDDVFIIGQGDRTGITVQYELTGISIQNPPDNYSTNLEFTITTDTP